ncbi:MAG: DUF4140 domain-containing protein [Desulfuromonadales bacterium]|nr:DUF4140 domain-containing protein [Desulfuromonadales bacterium]
MKWGMGIFTLILFATGNALANSRSITFFSDGAVVEIEATAAKGIVETPLPAGMIENSLHVKPMGSTVIQRVDLLPVRRESGGEHELDSLLERKNRLEDRLQALSTREDIFKAAAKSQSGKAPRKTKANPDPMQTIRQGTDFAIAQLEAVYTARRKTTQELRRVETRIAEVHTGSSGAGTLTRIGVEPKNGRVRIRCALRGQTWKPRYDIRINDAGKTAVTLFGQLPGPYAGYLLWAAPSALADAATARSLPVLPGSFARLAEYNLPMEDVHFGDGFATSFSAQMTNTSATYLPAGEAALYRKGEYLGRLSFKGISSGRSGRISNGI